jgi:hypothetical protein
MNNTEIEMFTEVLEPSPSCLPTNLQISGHTISRPSPIAPRGAYRKVKRCPEANIAAIILTTMPIRIIPGISCAMRQKRELQGAADLTMQRAVLAEGFFSD